MDGVWLIGSGEASFMRADGIQRGPYVWPWPTATAHGEELLSIVDRDGGEGAALSPEGEWREVALPSGLGSFEDLLHADERSLLTPHGHTLRRRADGRWRSADVHGGGLTDDGVPFLAAQVGRDSHVWLADGEHRVLALPPDATPATPPPARP